MIIKLVIIAVIIAGGSLLIFPSNLDFIENNPVPEIKNNLLELSDDAVQNVESTIGNAVQQVDSTIEDRFP